jgi:flavin reductase (DIM6/NTAB) family NADH-FMN oxidoreductase RutF
MLKNMRILSSKFGLTHWRFFHLGAQLKTVSSKENEGYLAFKNVIQLIPQTVCIVTASHNNVRRGVTCSSFSSVSMRPSVISFCLSTNGRMQKILESSNQLALHVLAQSQSPLALHFARQAFDGKDQFEQLPAGCKYSLSSTGVPLLSGCKAVFECSPFGSRTSPAFHVVGSHALWLAAVDRTHYNFERSPKAQAIVQPPLIYYMKAYHTVGDEMFMNAFENLSLPFDQWTHRAHLRMAYNYILRFGRDRAISFIRDGIQKFNMKNVSKIRTGYHETITQFFIREVDRALTDLTQTRGPSAPPLSFDEFVECAPHLLDKDYVTRFYSEQLLSTSFARHGFVDPDLKPFPVSPTHSPANS